MLLTWFSVGVEFMFVVRAMLTPFDTMLPTALTRLIAEAFCSADPDRLTLSFLVAIRLDPSTTMLSPAAEAMLTAPCVVATVWLLSTSWLEFVSDDVVDSAAVRFEAELLAESTLCIEAEFRALFALLLLALLEAEEFCAALLVLAELACWEAREALSLVVALLERAAFEAELMLEFAVFDALACCAALDVLALSAALLLAALLAEAEFAAFALLRASPAVDEALRFAESLADWFAALDAFCPEAEFAAFALLRASVALAPELWLADSLPEALPAKDPFRLEAELPALAPLVAFPALLPAAEAAGVEPDAPFEAE